MFFVSSWPSRLFSSLFAVCCLLSTPAFGGFTKITEGDIVNDGGWCYGCAWNDYDLNGYPDLFVVNNDSNKDNFLYRNRGDGTFEKITYGPVVNDGGSSYGCTWGDFDNDSYSDLFVSNYNENNFLYMNVGDSFVKITSGPVVNDGGRSTGCSWADYDCDGRLDLFVCNRNQVNFLYHNDGGGTFTRVLDSPIGTDVNNSSGCAWADYDNDGFLDLIVANVQTPNCLYHNEGDGTFTKVTEGPVVSDTSFCNGASWGDTDNDGDLDLFVATGVLGMYKDLLYRNNGDGTFTKITDSPVVTDATWAGGSGWGDFDNDGDLDLFVGMYDGHNRLYENDGTGTFTSIDTGVVVTDGNYIMGSAWADCDRDGDLDLFTARNNYFGGNNCLYQNDAADGKPWGTGSGVLGFRGSGRDLYKPRLQSDSVSCPSCLRGFHSGSSGNGNNWIVIRCVGTASNLSGIGARVRVKARIDGAGVWQTREVTTQSGGGNSGSPPVTVHFGLGDATVIDSLVIRWPSGIVQTLVNQRINEYPIIVERETGLEDERATLYASRALPTIVRGVLFLGGENGDCPAPSPTQALRGTVPCFPKPALLDISGRKVLALHPGPNDVSRLAPGVYFCTEHGVRFTVHAHKVIITK